MWGRVFAVSLAFAALLACAPSASAAGFIGSGDKKWAIVLCNFKDQPNAPRSMAYWQRYFTGAGIGSLGMVDYFRDVSFGQLNLANSTVVGWNNARNPDDLSKTLTRGEWQTLAKPFTPAPTNGNARLNRILACADGAQGFDFSSYWGVLAVFPEANSLTAAAIDADDSTVTLQGREHFPDGSAPFSMGIGGEAVKVTGRAENTFTIERATGATAHPAGTAVNVSGDLGGVGDGQLDNMPIGGKKYKIATVVLPHQTDVEITAHEMGHGNGWDHTRALSNSTNDYGDRYDVMSARGPASASFSADPRATNFQPGSGDNYGYVDEPGYFGLSVLGGQPGAKGPGLTAINLDKQGWIPNARHLFYSPPGQTTTTLRSLSDPGALAAPADQFLEARIPAAVTIQNLHPMGAAPSNPPSCAAPNGCTTSDYYSVEYRERSGFDRGLSAPDRTPGSGVVLHLHGQDGRGYWVDRAPAGAAVQNGGFLFAGHTYADTAQNRYLLVNSVNGPGRTARVTIGSDKIATKAAWTGDTSVDYSDTAKFAGNLKVDPSGDPVPRGSITLKAASRSCTDTTAADGATSCERRILDPAGSYTATTTFDGTNALKPTQASVPFTVNPETTKVTYTGATTSDYHDPFTAGATLVDPDSEGGPIGGASVTLTLGGGDSCTATTDSDGVATCEITPTQVPGSYSVTASFAGDGNYKASSDSASFQITKQETHLTYDAPAKVANDFPAKMQGTLTEEEAGGAPVAGRTVVFTLGSGASAQTCQDATDADGKAECTIASVAQPANATSVPAAVAFAGDAYYLPSDDGATVKLLYYTGRAYGASVTAAGLGLVPPQADTGSIQTSARSDTQRSAVIGMLPLITTNGLTGRVTTGGGISTSRGYAANLTIGLIGVPVIRATAIEATSTSTCAGATGATKITSLTIGGTPVTVGAGTSTIKAGLATVKLNERQPVPGADQGLTVYAMHVTVPGVADIIVGAAPQRHPQLLSLAAVREDVGVRCVYVDLDSTLLGPGASLLRGAGGAFSLQGVRALQACDRAGAEVVLMSGRRQAQVGEDARLLGQTSYIFEAGSCLVLDGEEHWLTGDLMPGEAGTIHDQIEASGAPALLLEHYDGRLEYHDPWHRNREVSHLFRGLVDAAEADTLLAEHGHGGLRLVDNGGVHRRSPRLVELAEVRAYHLVPVGASKAAAVARHMRARELSPGDVIAVGDSREDMETAAHVGAFWFVANAVERDPTLREAMTGRPNVRVAEESYGAGVYEAVVTTLAARGA